MVAVAEVQEAYTEPAAQDFRYRLKSGTLKVRGPITTTSLIQFVPREGLYKFSDQESIHDLAMIGPKGSLLPFSKLDIPVTDGLVEFSIGDTVACLVITLDKVYDNNLQPIIIILKALGGAVDTYQRVGIIFALSFIREQIPLTPQGMNVPLRIVEMAFTQMRR